MKKVKGGPNKGKIVNIQGQLVGYSHRYAKRVRAFVKRYGEIIDLFQDATDPKFWWAVIQQESGISALKLVFHERARRNPTTGELDAYSSRIVLLPRASIKGTSGQDFDQFCIAHPELYPTKVPKETDQRPAENPSLVKLQALSDELRTIREERIAKLQDVLFGLKGWSSDSVETKIQVAELIQLVADDVRRVFECPKCGQPGRFRCFHGPRNASGGFFFVHKDTKKHGGTVAIPKLQLVEPTYSWKKS